MLAEALGSLDTLFWGNAVLVWTVCGAVNVYAAVQKNRSMLGFWFMGFCLGRGHFDCAVL